jgi:hypothetical protein
MISPVKAGGVSDMASEAVVSQQARLVMAQIGGLPMRNNVGVAIDETGRHIRYGLMNASKQENDQFKSSDIVGPIPIVIQAHHVGKLLGVMSVFETKHSDWHMTPGDARAAAQLRFIELMRSVGAIGGFVTDPAQIRQYVDAFR